jgi:EAL domain-containing protein (putative c-di-GMP-specific phosphodiesterase class I)
MSGHLNFRLASAIADDQLALHYQPRLCAESMQVVGAEALLRWNSNGGGWHGVAALNDLDADEFDQLWRWNLTCVAQAFEQLKRLGWRPTESRPGFFISLNLSCKQIGSSCWADELLAMIKASDVPFQCVEVELTEHGGTDDFEVAVSSFEQVRNAGVAISLDDFPEGGSSFMRLAHLMFDKVKIDRGMVPKASDPVSVWMKKRDILGDLRTMVERMGARLVIEGIERYVQYSFLSSLEPHEWQGFLWGRAIPLSELIPRLCCIDGASGAESLGGKFMKRASGSS